MLDSFWKFTGGIAAGISAEYEASIAREQFNRNILGPIINIQLILAIFYLASMYVRISGHWIFLVQIFENTKN